MPLVFVFRSYRDGGSKYCPAPCPHSASPRPARQILALGALRQTPAWKSHLQWKSNKGPCTLRILDKELQVELFLEHSSREKKARWRVCIDWGERSNNPAGSGWAAAQRRENRPAYRSRLGVTMVPQNTSAFFD